MKIVFLFDEIDKLVDKEGDHQQVLNPILETVNSNMILISNRIEALKKLDPRLMSRISPAREFVEQYNTGELKEILKRRAEIALEKESYDLEALEQIGEWCFETSGDLREALNLLFEIANKAQQKDCRITADLIPLARENLEEIEFDKIYLSLPIHQKFMIAGIAVISKREIEGYAEHKSLYEFYERHARKKGSDPVGLRQFENYLRKLQLLNLIAIANKSPKNRRGRITVSFPLFDVDRFLHRYIGEPV